MTDKTARGTLIDVMRGLGFDFDMLEAQAAFDMLDVAGFAVVPKEPGDDVRKAMYATWDSFGDDATMGPREAVALYRAMLAASNPKEEGSDN